MNIYYVAGVPYSDELYHHGILGQKWGIRRYQNPDGTLTPEGRRRYSKNPAYVYRNKYGEETDAGKARSEARWKKFFDSTEIGENGWRTDESILKYTEQQEKELKQLFDNSPNRKMRDPEIQERIKNAWHNAIFQDYDGDFTKVKNTKEYKELVRLEKQATEAYKRAEPLFQKYWDTSKLDNPSVSDKAWKEYKNSKENKELESIHADIRSISRKLGGMIKMRTMNDIMRQVTPEMRDAVYDMMSENWDYD